MTNYYTRRLALLGQEQHRALLGKGLRGIERETLRVNPDGKLALTPHPRALGSALTQPQITTDYSESLLEFITPPENDVAVVMTELEAIHRFAYSQLGDEMLWSDSMPCELPDEEQIPIAWYGTSHIGMLKHVYRRGLALRYGKRMQCIAGIHYNYSLADEIWAVLQLEAGQPTCTTKSFQSDGYIALIRNFRRYSWLLMYLFGASPALSKNFLAGQEHKLETLDEDTLYLPYATSLRMSDLGYQSKAQENLTPHYNNLDSYIKSLSQAVSQSYPPYAAIGTHRDGEWIQINTNILQIENEYYSTIRPKRVINSGERPIQALSARGVQYIEVRCMDIDPFEPTGISLETGRFLDAFLLFCALDDSPCTSDEESVENVENFSKVVKEGRRPGLALQHNGASVTLQAWGLALLEKISAAATLLDAQRDDHQHSDALEKQRRKLHDPELTPSAQVLAALTEHNETFAEFALRQSNVHAAQFRAYPPSAEEHAYFAAMAVKSLEEQDQIERTQTGDFDTFVAAYRASTLGNMSV
ncbi:glutamate--cysteine ligase [Glaciimonas sp. Gout2]|uniref:glutamate--cysteine ligase n=1 Tax=unclassified Glaciimonas TaxID=2644401 RepID=UPI002B231D86|nr:MULTISPECIES: glutamate--cysteine ligase [unclassified Glaciimonas]MEB0012335.1 glutamate--cysteine ligase [Glaciimonas sp. Cout2]MEB0080479.1 glutamate--cysteine ligase [Glaciimonas sp. Gout2]